MLNDKTHSGVYKRTEKKAKHKIGLLKSEMNSYLQLMTFKSEDEINKPFFFGVSFSCHFSRYHYLMNNYCH